jgi:hypothetical protein
MAAVDLADLEARTDSEAIRIGAADRLLRSQDRRFHQSHLCQHQHPLLHQHRRLCRLPLCSRSLRLRLVFLQRQRRPKLRRVVRPILPDRLPTAGADDSIATPGAVRINPLGPSPVHPEPPRVHLLLYLARQEGLQVRRRLPGTDRTGIGSSST